MHHTYTLSKHRIALDSLLLAGPIQAHCNHYRFDGNQHCLAGLKTQNLSPMEFDDNNPIHWSNLG
jgi:hypothetical protein